MTTAPDTDTTPTREDTIMAKPINPDPSTDLAVVPDYPIDPITGEKRLPSLREVTLPEQMALATNRSLVDLIGQAVYLTVDLIIELFSRGDWPDIGYSTWKDLCEGEFHDLPIRIPNTEEVLALRAAGMSYTEIEDSTGMSRSTAHRIAKAAEPEQEPVDAEVIEEPPLTKEEQAIKVITDHPEMTQRQVSELVGCSVGIANKAAKKVKAAEILANDPVLAAQRERAAAEEREAKALQDQTDDLVKIQRVAKTLRGDIISLCEGYIGQVDGDTLRSVENYLQAGLDAINDLITTKASA